MIWQVGAFPFRDGDSATLQRIMDVMHRDGHWITDPDTPAYLLKIDDASALVYLRMTVASDFDSVALEPEESCPSFLLIAAEDRPECERLLRENCPSRVQWFSVVVVGTSTSAELAKFTAVYAEHMDVNFRKDRSFT